MASPPNQDFAGRLAIVTGAARGLGRAAAAGLRSPWTVGALFVMLAPLFLAIGLPVEGIGIPIAVDVAGVRQ